MKYIIEIKPEYEANCIMILGARDSHLYVTTLEVKDLEELNSDYINEHYGDLQDTAYHRGLEEGNNIGYKDGVKDGQNESWECARKIVCDESCGGMSMKELLKIFNRGSDAYILRDFTAQQAIEKLKAYEEKQKADDEIKVKDEVIWTHDENVVIVVTSIYTVDGMEWCDGVCKDGRVYSILTKNARKTGKHFDIDKILEEMRK